MAGLGGDFRCPEPDTCRHRSRSGRMVSARHGTPWQARRVPPEAVPVCKRRDPPVPLTGKIGNGQGARQPETEPPGHHADEPGG